MFERELTYFIENQDALVAKHAGRFLIIRGNEVAGVFDDALHAYLSASQMYEAGSFMIQPCEAGPSAYTVTLASSEAFF